MREMAQVLPVYSTEEPKEIVEPGEDRERLGTYDMMITRSRRVT